MMRALLYARYSTTLQSSLSIDDQLRVCTDLCTRQGWTVAGQHCDAAISGAVRDRPGLNALLSGLGPDTTVVAESIDRLSRDQEDIAAIFKAVCYAGARIWTLSEGEVGELHIGLRGTMAAMTRKDTADKVRRGLTGRALAGMNPGGMAYGYRKVPKFDDRGEPVRGLREIHPDQADVIRRIFAEYASGRTARQIAERLNAERVPAPSGGLWRVSTIHGDAKRKNGILHNDLYRGLLVYNRTRRVMHPVTRRREIRINPESEWLKVEAPDLRIVSEAQWNAAVALRQQFTRATRTILRRPRRLLSGKAECGVCGGSIIIQGSARWGCANHFDGRQCSNGTTIKNEVLERRVLHGLSEQLLDPDLVVAYVAEWQAARTERLASSGKERRQLERRKADAERRIARMVEAYADGRIDVDALASSMADAKAERDRATAALAEVAAEKVVALHPGLAGQYRRRIVELTAAVDGEDALGARNAIRALIDKIVITPAEGRGTAIEVHGLLATILEIATGRAPECPVRMVPLERVGRNRTLLKIAV